ncbi:MAG: hypothetical protein ACRDXE_10705 [Acidimicrobiales bacterium]
MGRRPGDGDDEVGPPPAPLAAAPTRFSEWAREYRHVVLAAAVALAVAGGVFLLFQVQANADRRAIQAQQSAYRAAINSRDDTITRLATAYAKLRDQDFSLGVSPAAPSLAAVVANTPDNPKIPLPKSFTVAFPQGITTCTDKTGEGNFVCTNVRPPPRPSPTTTVPGG